MKLVQKTQFWADVLKNMKPRFEIGKVSIISVTDTKFIVAIDELGGDMLTALTIETESTLDISNKYESFKLMKFAKENLGETSTELNNAIDTILTELSEDDEDNKEVIEFLMTNGDMYHVPADTINWEQNAENIGNIENNISNFKELATRLMLGMSTVAEVLSTANEALQSLGIKFDDKFFENFENVTDREKALCALFDLFYVYSTIGNMTNIYIAHAHFQSEMEKGIAEVMSTFVGGIGDMEDIGDSMMAHIQSVEDELDEYADDDFDEDEILGNAEDVFGGD